MGDDTARRLAEIEKRANAATEGPWQAYSQGRVDPATGDITEVWVEVRGNIRRDGKSWTTVASTPELEPDAGVEQNESQSDAEFIAAARADLPWLVGIVREVRRLLVAVGPDDQAGADHAAHTILAIAATVGIASEEDTP